MKTDQLVPTKKFLEGMLKLILVAFVAGSVSQCIADKAIASETDGQAYYQIYSGVNFNKERVGYAKETAIAEAEKQCDRVRGRLVIIGIEMRASNEAMSAITAKVQYNCVWSSI